MADKRPQEQQNDKEKQSKKKENETNADLLKKGIAERVTKFLSTTEGQQAISKGKDFFITQFLASWESSDADAMSAFKEIIGKKPDEELNLKDLADIKISYDTTFENYVDGAEKSQFTKIQEKAITHTFLEKMDKEMLSKHFDQPHRDAWQQHVMSKKNQIEDRADLNKELKSFFNRAGLVLSNEQKKRLNNISIELRDVASHMTEQAGFDKEATAKLNTKQIISANTDVEDMVKRFLRSYTESELAPAYARFQKEVSDVSVIYKVPGFQRVLEKYDLSVGSLIKSDKTFSEIYTNKDMSADRKNEAQQKAIVRAITKDDKELAELVDGLFANEFNLAKLSKEYQQLYVDRFQSMWADSKEMKKFDELFTKMGVDVSDRKDLMNQVFDLSKNELIVTGKDGKKYTLSLQKKIIDRTWSAENMSEQLAHELPVAFLISANENLDDAYVQKLAKVTDKQFVLRDADGKDVKLFPGHLIEVTTKDGKKHVGYVYRDPENNIMLSAEPGSKNRTILSEESMKTATVRIIESTYSLNVEDIPVLVSEIALMRAAAELPEEEQKKALNERNSDIAQQVVASVEERKNLENHPTDAEIESFDWEDLAAVRAMDEQKAKEWKEHMDRRIQDISRRTDNINKSIEDQDNIIKSLNEQIKVQGPKNGLDKNTLAALRANLAEAKEKRNEHMDEKSNLQKKSQHFQNAQKKLQDKTHNDKQKKNLTVGGVDSALEDDEHEKTFAEAWSDLNGDKTISEPQVGKTCLMLLLPDTTSSTGGGGGAWMRGELVGYDPLTLTMQIKWHGVESSLASKDGGSLEGKVTTIEGAEGLLALKRAAGKLYKFKKYNNIVDWGLDLKGSIEASDNVSSDARFQFDKKYEGWVKHIKDDIDFSSMVNQKTKKPIKYFGKKVGNERVWYEIDQRSGSIKVKELQLEDKKDKDGNPISKELKVKYKKDMPINDFMMFSMEKDLRGYTQEEVDAANGGDEDDAKKGSPFIKDWVDASEQGPERMGGGLFGLRWGNIAGVMSSWDIVKKGVKNYFDEKAKKGKSVVENTMLTSKWFNGMTKLPIIGGAFDDIKGGIESKLDNEKKKKITEYKDEVGTKKNSSSNGASDFIKAVLTDGEAKKDPLKAAGYYLAALENGNPYFRSLKEFKGTGRWVGKILGEKYRMEYLAYIKNVENELQKNPTSKELNNDLSMQELGFMQKVFNEGGKNGVQDELKAMAGNWFFAGGLGQFQYGNGWYNSSKIEETAKNEGSKPFHQLFGDSWTGWYEGGRINDVLGVLKLLSEKVGGNEDYYYKWAGSMLMPMMNGEYRTDMAPSYKAIYQSIARKNAFPFAGYMTEGNATEKVQELMDIFSGGSLGKAMAGKTSMADRTKAFKEWWESGQGREALDSLQNPKELFSMKSKLEKQLTDQEKLNQYNTLSDYINKKYNDSDRSGITEQVDGESIIYQKNILSAPSGFVKEQMLNFSNGQFKGRSEKNGPELWEALKSKLNEINNIDESEMSPEFFAFVLKRYFAMFQTKYNLSGKKAFMGALKFPNIIPEIFRLNVRRAFDRKQGGNDLPAEVEDTLVVFEHIFKKFAPLVKKHPEIIEDVFEDSRMLEFYHEITPENLQKTADNMKSLESQLRERIALGLVDENEDDVLYDQAA